MGCGGHVKKMSVSLTTETGRAFEMLPSVLIFLEIKQWTKAQKLKDSEVTVFVTSLQVC